MITTDPVSSACKAIHMLLMKTCLPAVFREFITIANSSAVSLYAFRIQTVGSSKKCVIYYEVSFFLTFKKINSVYTTVGVETNKDDQ